MSLISKNRYLNDFISEDLNEKMVFLGGPRQVGKTTLALTILSESLKESNQPGLEVHYQLII